MEKKKEIDLVETLDIIKKKVKLIILLPVLAMVTCGIIITFLIQPIYQAETTLIVSMGIPKGDENATAMNSSLRLSRELVPTYKGLVRTKNIKAKVEEIIYQKTGIKEINSKPSVKSEGSTELMYIIVEDKDPKMASLYANVLTQVFAQEVPNMIEIDNVRIIDNATEPESPSKPNKKLYIITAGVLGFLIALGLVFLNQFFDNTVKKTNDIKKELAIPVLGVIPKYDKKH